MTIPIINWRHGERYYITQFIQIDNPDINEVYEDLKVDNNDEYIERVARFINLNFEYPLNPLGNPATESLWCRYLVFPLTFLCFCYKKWIYKDYIWQFPNETLVLKYGICIDTALLCTSLLRKKGVNAWCILGSVNDTQTDQILGYHAWTEVYYRGEWWIIETTIHDPSLNNMIPAKEAYDKNSEFAKQTGIYYVKMAWFNEKEYDEEKSLLPTLYRFIGREIKKQEFRKMERKKQKAIWNAYKLYCRR